MVEQWFFSMGACSWKLFSRHCSSPQQLLNHRSATVQPLFSHCSAPRSGLQRRSAPSPNHTRFLQRRHLPLHHLRRRHHSRRHHLRSADGAINTPGSSHRSHHLPARRTREKQRLRVRGSLQLPRLHGSRPDARLHGFSISRVASSFRQVHGWIGVERQAKGGARCPQCAIICQSGSGSSHGHQRTAEALRRKA